jgi:hypothetical protein
LPKRKVSQVVHVASRQTTNAHHRPLFRLLSLGARLENAAGGDRLAVEAEPYRCRRALYQTLAAS